MASSASKHHQPSSSRPPKIPPIITLSNQNQNPNPNSTTPNVNVNVNVNVKITLCPSEDQPLSRASHLTRPELLLRRSRRLRQICRCYKDFYWALMEELKVQFRDYYWNYGVSPFKDRQQQQQQQLEENGVEWEIGDHKYNNGEGSGENVSNKKNNNNNNYQRCLFVGCKLKAMALTSFCHLHILSDFKQKLYKPCDYVIKSALAGPITCGKPILRSTVPPLCSVHFQKAQKHVTRALKKAGLNVSSSSKLAPKFHVIVAEYIRQIQAKRRNALKKGTSKAVVKEER